MSAVKTDFRAAASEFISSARAEGFSVFASGEVVTLVKRFTPGDREAFVGCDMIAPGILLSLPAGCGSMWGTDGGSIGGMSAMSSGVFKLNRSGIRKRVVSEIAKILARGV
jgi:hypothetical protein